VNKQLAYLYPLSDMQTKAITKCIDSLCIYYQKTLNVSQSSLII